MRHSLSCLFAFAIATSAAAVDLHGWEKPVARAQMQIVESHGPSSDARKVELIMTRQDEASSPTGFVLLIDDQAAHYAVVKVRADDCGNPVYLASPMTDGSTISIHSYRLVVADHLNSRCGSGEVHTLPISSGWEAELVDQGQLVLRLSGVPEQLMTPMDQ